MKVLHILVLNILAFLDIFVNSQYCPEYKAEHMAWFNDDYKIINYLKIPKTNILLVNTILQSQTDILNSISNVVYYLDISLPQNNTIAAIKSDYTIVNMEYVEELNKILISNQFQILLAEPYTLQATKIIYLEEFNLLKRISNTNYVVVAQKMCQNFLIDIFTLSIVNSFNGCYNGIYYRQISNFMKTFTLSNGYVLISITEPNGYQTWIFNNNTAQVAYYGYLKLNGTVLQSEFTDLDKHDQYDIIFVIAQPYYINVIQIIEGNPFKFQTLLSMNVLQQTGALVNIKFIMNSQQQSLYFTDRTNIYRIDIQINQTSNNNFTAAFPNLNNLKIMSIDYQYAQWYYVPENQLFVLPTQKSYLSQCSNTFYYYLNNQTYQNQFYLATGVTRIYQVIYNQSLFYVTGQSTYLNIAKDYVGGPITQLQLPNNVKLFTNSVIKVQNCDTCFVILVESQTIYYQEILKQEFSSMVDIGQQFGLNLLQINTNIDAYYDEQQDATWVLFALPQKTQQEKFLFHFIDIKNKQYLTLSSGNPDDDSNETCYALYSKSNQKIVGLDVLGNVYVWDSAQKQKFNYKIQIAEYQCLNSVYGQLYNDGQTIYLIAVCEDFQIISFNIVTGKTQQIIKINSIPNHINSFEEIQLIGFGDNEKAQSDNLYGFGTKASPFTSSQSLIQLILHIQKYYYFVNGIEQITANIYIDPKYQITFKEELFNFSFSSSININIQSQDTTNQAQIKTSELLHFSSFQSIQLQNLLFNFDVSTDQDGKCGLAFQQVIMSVLLSNITNYSQNNSINCYQVYTVNSTIILQDINIQNQNFSSLTQIVLVQDTSKVNDVQVVINSFKILQNKCNQSQNQSSEIVGQLFQASQYLVDDLQIINNQFCNQLIFSTISSVNQLDFTFSFSNVVIRNNQFYTTASYLFFNAIYYFNLFPMHTFILQNIDIFNNTNYSTQNTNKQSFNTTFFIQLNKLSNITLSNITFKNHFEIALISASSSQNVNIYNITCSNDQGFQRSYQSSQYAGCVYFSDISQLDLNLFRASNINSSDNSILSSINQESSKNSIINLINVEVFNSNFIQSLTNTYSNPIFISSPSNSQIKIEKSSFHDNNLIGLINSETQSTTAIQIVNPLGSVLLNDILFNNSNSNSVYNYIYIQSNIAIFQSCVFSKSSYDATNQKAIFKQQGGCARVKSNNLQILNSQFLQSTSYSGSFVYIDPLSQNLKILINQSSFSEGYSQSDGSSLFVQSQNTKLDFQILNSNFTDIFSFSQDSNSISIQSDQISSISSGNILISKVIAQNILGMNNNSFVNAINSNATIQNLQAFQTQYPTFTSQFDSSKNLKDFFLAAIIYTQNSNVSFIKCNFTNLSGTQNSMNPLLIQSSNSLIILQNSYTLGCIFTQSLINMQFGELIIQNSTFYNITQILNKNRIIQSNQQENSKQSSSLIIMSNSSLKIIQNTLFNSIKCLNNCYGSSIYLSYTSFNISNTQFINSQSSFGGAISIFGMNQNDNFLFQSYFNNNNATYNGGAIHLNVYQNDAFQMQITETQFLNNKALTGYGGAIYISSQGVNSTQQNVIITQSQISNNQAMMGGGIYNQGINPQLDSLSSVSHNQASYNGDNQYSYPTELYLTNQNTFNHSFNQEKQIIVLNDFKSGGVLPSFEFQMRDQNQKPYVLFNNQIISAYFQISNLTKQKELYSIRGNQIVNMDQKTNLFDFDELTLVGIPDSISFYEFKSDSIHIFNNQTQAYDLDYSYLIQVNFRNCQHGEIIKKYSNFLECQTCEPGKFSLDYTGCYPCPNGGSCANGKISLLPGYWREQEDSEEIIYCINRPENCVGESYGNLVCQQGYVGPLCEECDNMNQAQRKLYLSSIIRPKEIIESKFPETNPDYQKNILFKQRDSKQITKESDAVINWMNLNSNMTQTQSPQIQIQSPKQDCLSMTDSVFSMQLINEPKSTNQTNQDSTKFKTKLEQLNNKKQY
ncbi:hypothetical protein ABPG73_004590 [Tetrahymena malaccensis]